MDIIICIRPSLKDEALCAMLDAVLNGHPDTRTPRRLGRGVRIGWAKAPISTDQYHLCDSQNE